jgi:hypothetical protein
LLVRFAFCLLGWVEQSYLKIQLSVRPSVCAVNKKFSMIKKSDEKVQESEVFFTASILL